MNSSRFLFIMLLMLSVALMLLLMPRDNSVEMDASEYCEMVHIHQLGQRDGWPDYQHNYAKQCMPDGTLNLKYMRGEK